MAKRKMCEEEEEEETNRIINWWRASDVRSLEDYKELQAPLIAFLIAYYNERQGASWT
jgi:hypothetical protein